MSEYGRDLRVKYKTDDDIFTINEIINAGFVYLPTPNFITDKDNNLYHGSIGQYGSHVYPMASRIMKLKSRFSHDWDDSIKQEAKKEIIKELNLYGLVFIHKVFLTGFADDTDYSNCCYDIRVLVKGSKQKIYESIK